MEGRSVLADREPSGAFHNQCGIKDIELALAFKKLGLKEGFRKITATYLSYKKYGT
jgi:hypothetical protein